MKIILLILLVGTCYAQKTSREVIFKTSDITVTRNITETDTTFFLMGQNAKYMRIIDIVMVKSGSARELNDLLAECMKFLNEKNGTSEQYEGNTLMVIGNRIALYGKGIDDYKYILLNPGLITRMQANLQPYL